jgi:hypothetical protein
VAELLGEGFGRFALSPFGGYASSTSRLNDRSNETSQTFGDAVVMGPRLDSMCSATMGSQR